jgi:hypothetical protein
MMTSGPLDVRMAHLEGAFEQLDKRIGDLIVSVDARFAQVDARFAQVDARFAQVDTRFAHLEARMDALAQKFDSLQWRMTSLILVTWVTTMLAIFFKH